VTAHAKDDVNAVDVVIGDLYRPRCQHIASMDVLGFVVALTALAVAEMGAFAIYTLWLLWLGADHARTSGTGPA
jgi:hypothetical protein